MKLNFDCLRDVLIALEENLKMDDDLIFIDLELEEINNLDMLSGYSNADIYYSIFNLVEIDFIDGQILYADGGIPHSVSVSNISYSGHEFLQTIKSATVWENVKSKITPVAELSIPIISEVAQAFILSKLGL